MARQVVIGDLVVKVGVDSKSAARELRKFRENVGRYEKSSVKNSKEKLNNEKKSTEEVDKRARREEEARRKRERERRAVERHERRVARVRSRVVSGSAKATGRLGLAVGSVGMAGAVAGGAAIMGTKQSLVRLRTAENVFNIATKDRGLSQVESNEMRDRIIRQTLPYGVDSAMVLKTVGDLASTMESPLEVIEQFAKGTAVLGSVYGLNQQQMQGFMTGTRQFFSGAMDWDNVKQLFENMGISAQEMADSLGVTKKEFLKAGSEGRIKDIVAKAGGIDKVFKAFSEEMTDRALKAFDNVDNSLPILEKITASFWSNSVNIFATGFEQEYKGVLKDITTFLAQNGPLFKAGGEAFGVGLEVMWTAFTEFLSPFQEDINQWVDMWNTMGDESKRKYLIDIGNQFLEAVKMFAIAYGILKSLDIALTTSKFINTLKTLGIVGEASLGSYLASFAGTTAGVATAGVTAMAFSPKLGDATLGYTEKNYDSALDSALRNAKDISRDKSVFTSSAYTQSLNVVDGVLMVTIKDAEGNIFLTAPAASSFSPSTPTPD